MREFQTADDRELVRLTRKAPEAFGVFYARHELAADLCAESFAEALQACRQGSVAQVEVPVAWLFGIAAHKLADCARSGQVEVRARDRLQMRAIELTRGQLSDIERLLDEEAAATLLDGLGPQQRTAVSAYVLAGEPYAQIAAQTRCRGLAVLRTRLGAAQ